MQNQTDQWYFTTQHSFIFKFIDTNPQPNIEILILYILDMSHALQLEFFIAQGDLRMSYSFVMITYIPQNNPYQGKKNNDEKNKTVKELQTQLWAKAT